MRSQYSSCLAVSDAGNVPRVVALKTSALGDDRKTVSSDILCIVAPTGVLRSYIMNNVSWLFKNLLFLKTAPNPPRSSMIFLAPWKCIHHSPFALACDYKQHINIKT